MGLILNIETSTEICSVSISDKGRLIDLIVDNPSLEGGDGHGQHSKLLAVLIEKLFSKNNIEKDSLDAVAISEGPGSYTGLRIGVSTAKGICFGTDIPLISLNTLKLIALMASKKNSQEFDLIVPMIDARRMEVYCSVYDNKLNEIDKTEAKVIDETSFSEYKGKRILFCGNGALKCQDVLSDLNAVFDGEAYPSAEFMTENAYKKFANQDFADLVYFEPFYLKSFIATTPKKLL